MRVAIVHEWLTSAGAPERFLEALAEIYPQAPIYTLAYRPKNFAGWQLSKHSIHTSFLQRLPRSRKNRRGWLPLTALAIEQLDLRPFDVIISSSHSVAKGVLTRSDQLHISYTHSPARYASDNMHQYSIGGDRSRGAHLAARTTRHYLRLWDTAAANRVDLFVANSNYVARQLFKSYRRAAEVIYPPVDVDRFHPRSQRQDFYLAVSRQGPEHMLEMILTVFSRLGLPLVVIGDAQKSRRMKRLAGPNVVMMGEPGDSLTWDHMERCKAYVHAGSEEFGVTPVEALAAGAPVIAYGKGAVLEAVIPGRSGLLYPEERAESLEQAITWFQEGNMLFDPRELAERALLFSKATFQREFRRLVDESWERFLSGLIGTYLGVVLPVQEPQIYQP